MTVTELKPKTIAFIEEGNVQRKAGRKLTELALHAWEIKKELDRLKDELSRCNEKIAQAVSPGCAVEIPGQVRITVAERQTVKVTDADALEQILGPRFEDLVDIRVSYRPLPKLVRMATDGDDPLGKTVRQALSFETGVTVTYRYAK